MEEPLEKELVEAAKWFYKRAKWVRNNGCGDNGCLFHIRGGQGTNGGCNCFGTNHSTAVKKIFDLVEKIEQKELEDK